MTTWSYSSLKMFEQCPRKYYHLREVGDVQDTSGPAANYGKKFHTAAEEYVRDGKPLGNEFILYKELLDTLIGIEGVKFCELELGVKKKEQVYTPCDFGDDSRWWRGIADLVIIHGAKAYSVDYKTSKNARYADLKQLDYIAAAIFLHNPEVEEIKSSLLFVKSKDLIKKRHYRENLGNYFNSALKTLASLEGAKESGVWNPISTPLCGYCPVVECEHNTT